MFCNSQRVALTLIYVLANVCTAGQANLSMRPYVCMMRCGSSILKSAVR